MGEDTGTLDEQAKNRLNNVRARAARTHERAAELHKRAADFYERSAVTDREHGREAMALDLEEHADRERVAAATEQENADRVWEALAEK